MRRGPLVAFDGQSLNVIPAVNNFPRYVMAGRNLPAHCAAIGGTSWTALAPGAPSRCFLPQRSYAAAVLVMTGGYADVVGEGDSGATAYADQVAYAAAARTAGFDRVIAVTMTHGTATSAGDLADIAAYNALIRANGGGVWDGVADFDALPELSDPSNLTYFLPDGLHYNDLGSQVAADCLAPVLDAVLSDLAA